MTDIVRALAVIASQLGHVQSDLSALRQEVTAVRADTRRELVELRGDLTVHDAAKNEVLADALKSIAANKKKLIGSPIRYRS